MSNEPNRLTIAHRHLLSNGITMHLAEEGKGPPVVLLHGLPELCYSWRHQLPALASAQSVYEEATSPIERS